MTTVTIPPSPPGKISSRIEATLEAWATRWSARLGEWGATFLASGVNKFADILGQSYSKKIGKLLDTLEKGGNIPEELQPLFAEMRHPTGEVSALLSSSTVNSVLGGLLDRLAGPILLPVARAINQLNPQVKIGADIVLQYALRHPDWIDREAVRLHQWGFNDEEIVIMRELLHPLLPSDVIAPAWLRNPTLYEKYWDDVKRLGLTDDQIKLLKEMAYRVPGVQDVVRYAVKEVYNSKLTKLFRTQEEYPTEGEADAHAAGVRPTHLMKEWQAHWDLPSAGQGFAMLHRGTMTQEELDMLLKALDIMPFFRDKLTEIAWDIPNRVELRMMARYGLVDKPFLVDALRKAGLHEDYRGIVADMMLAQGLLQDLSAQYGKKWLTSAEVKERLAAVGLSADVQDRMYRWIVANAGPERTASQRDLTLAQIIKGAKQGILTQLETIDQIMALGYDEVEATYIYAIELPQAAEAVTDELRIEVDTIRRRRRDRLISREQEITQLVQAGVSSALAAAYADNDDLRLVKAEVSVEARERIKAQLEAQKTAIDTIRRRRRERSIDRATELADLINLGVVDLVALVYVENDDLRLEAVKVALPPAVVPAYQTEAGKVAVENIRLRRRSRLIEHDQEVAELVALEMSLALAAAYADNDDMRLEGEDALRKVVAEMSALTAEQRDQVDAIRERRLIGLTLHAQEVKELTTLGLSSRLAEAIAAEDDLKLA